MKATEPGQVISVDQLESTTPGFVAQLKGILTTKRYKAVTVFIDHFSDATFIYVQESLDRKQQKFDNTGIDSQVLGTCELLTCGISAYCSKCLAYWVK
eukprot:13648273-Ditylum_brightwellii.AAC.1